MKRRAKKIGIAAWRLRVVQLGFLVIGVALTARAVELQVFQRDVLQLKGQAKQHRSVPIPAHRGALLDRNGELLAISTPVDSVTAKPAQLSANPQHWPQLLGLLKLNQSELTARLRRVQGREFMYLKRQIDPDMAAQLAALDVPGVDLRREFKRYYPAGEVTAHIIGLTNIDDLGQEGMELALEPALAGVPGKKRVLTDRTGRAIGDVEQIAPAEPGESLRLSIDRRLQYLAYRELKAAVAQRSARSASLVLVDIPSGSVLAMVNQPSYNPNRRDRIPALALRNRAATDLFEPGSTIKPLTIAAALESGQYQVNSTVQTSPGFIQVGEHTVRDRRNLGELDLTGVIRQSSNVGASMIALSLEAHKIWALLQAFGLGQVTGSQFPGEAQGVVRHADQWGVIEQATVAYGYGVSVTPLQLVRAYAAIAAGGLIRPISLVHREFAPPGRRIISSATAAVLTTMLEAVVAADGTGRRAKIAGYRVAGKTGTARKSTAGGYSDNRYVAVFAGFAPLDQPRLAAVVIVDEPQGEEYYGGQVAAPIFSAVVGGALRLLNVKPDGVPAKGPT